MAVTNITLPILDESFISSLCLCILLIPLPSDYSLCMRAVGQCICLLTLTREPMLIGRAPRQNSECLVCMHMIIIISAIFYLIWTVSNPSLDLLDFGSALQFDGVLLSGCSVNIFVCLHELKLFRYFFCYSNISRAQIISLHLICARIVLTRKSVMSYLRVSPQVSFTAWLTMANAIKYY